MASSYEEMLAQQGSAASSLVNVAQALILGAESHAVSVNNQFGPCTQRDDLWMDTWGIDQNKVMSAKKIAPGGYAGRGVVGGDPRESCYNQLTPMPAPTSSDPNTAN